MLTNTTELSSSLNDYVLFKDILMGLKISLIVMIIGGNVLTICVICRFKTLRYPSNIMIAALAASDILMGLVYTPIMLIQTSQSFRFSDRASCLAFVFTGQSLVFGNVVFQSTLSVERFYAVQFPYHYHTNVTIKSNLISSVVALAGIIFVNIPMLCGIDDWETNTKCYPPTLFPCLYTVFYISAFLIFQLVGLLAFLRVLFAELTFRRRDRSLQMSDVQKQQSVQSTIMVLAYGISLCFYMPHVFYYLWGTISKKQYDPVTLGILQLLNLCSSAVNCFIYGFKNSKFRHAYKRFLGFKNSLVNPATPVRNVTDS